MAIGPIGVPSLYVWSDGDPVVRRRTAGLTAKPDGKWVTGPYRFVALEGIGHWISEEAQELTSRLVVKHVRGSKGGERKPTRIWRRTATGPASGRRP